MSTAKPAPMPNSCRKLTVEVPKARKLDSDQDGRGGDDAAAVGQPLGDRGVVVGAAGRGAP